MKARRRYIILLVAPMLSILAACGGGAIPAPAGPEEVAPASARDLVERSVAAHGGNLFDEVADLSVSYAGEWGFVASRLQPIIADRRYRKSSEERYLLAEGLVFQRHRGPAGTKTVLRRPGEVEVAYDEVETADELRRASSALVADAYLMLTTGPSFFLRDGVELTVGSPERLGGRAHDVVLARLRPGFGFSDEDRAQLWIDRETRLLRRVQFTLEGFAKTRGAEVDVTFSDHREIAGFVWPTRFVERIREPIDVFAHRWTLEGLDVDRGLASEDVARGELSGLAQAPALPMAPGLDNLF